MEQVAFIGLEQSDCVVSAPVGTQTTPVQWFVRTEPEGIKEISNGEGDTLRHTNGGLEGLVERRTEQSTDSESSKGIYRNRSRLTRKTHHQQRQEEERCGREELREMVGVVEER